MGSLAFAAGGALQGLGQGLNEVGQMSMKDQIEQTHERLRQDFEASQQEKQQAHAAGMQQAGFTEQEKMHGIEHGEAVQAATATHEFELKKAETETASRERIGHGHDVARLDAAAISGYSRSGSKNSGANTVKPFQFQRLSHVPTGPDGKPIPGALPEQTAVQFDPNTGISWIQHGDRFLRSDENGKPVQDPKTLNRVPAKPAEIAALNANPYAKVPAGYKNAGMTYMEAFEAEHGYVPGTVIGTVRSLAQQQARESSQQSSGFKLPSGRMYQPGFEPSGGGADAGSDESDEDNNPDDTAPAKEPGT
jgi:hypothetical protein